MGDKPEAVFFKAKRKSTKAAGSGCPILSPALPAAGSSQGRRCSAIFYPTLSSSHCIVMVSPCTGQNFRRGDYIAPALPLL
jgi:hypothetical protein